MCCKKKGERRKKKKEKKKIPREQPQKARAIVVNEARPMGDRPRGGSGGFRRQPRDMN